MKREILLATGIGAAVAAHLGHGAEEVSLAEHERRQGWRGDPLEIAAMPRKRRVPTAKEQRRQIARADHNDLVATSQRQIVLGHIHPRWLRADVEALLDAGQDVVTSDIEEMRKAGPR